MARTTHKFLHEITLSLLLLITSYAAQAQLRVFPVHRPVPETSPPAHAQGRTRATPPLLLPFFDDFSKPHQRVFADTVRWERSYSVLINDGMAIHPPTINVATFDGLDSAGSAYNPNDVLLTGYADQLVSRPIDMSTDHVSVAQRQTVYISFFYQWGGFVEGPDERDFLQLDFRNSEDVWETALTIFPKENPDPTRFYDTIIAIRGDQFFHDRFQFRFRSLGRLSGPYDAWHLDYVYVNKDRTLNDLSFPDRAMSTQLGPLFGPYRAMPRNHFFSNSQLTPPTFEIQNMKNEDASVNFRTEGFFSSTDTQTGNTTTYQVVLSKATPINITNNVILAKEHRTVRMDTLPDINDPQQFPADPGIDSTLIRLTLALQTRDNIPFNRTPPIEPDSTGDYTRNYEPIRFTTNDTLTADYVLSSYYAYDDGFAEYAAGLIETGNMVAYAFEIDTSYALKQDTLIGFDVYFPPYAITSNQTVDFFIYHDDNGMPGEAWLRIPARRVQRKGINQFQRIQFLPALLVDEPRFYIGWKEPVAGQVVVGLDMSGDTGDRIFVNTGGAWYQNDDVRGNLMLRPVFGPGIIDSSVGIEEQLHVALYPNPTRGIFYLEGDAQMPEIMTSTGKPVRFAHTQTERGIEINIAHEPPGLYIVRFRAGGTSHTRKVIMVR